MTVPEDFQMQNLENIPFVVQQVASDDVSDDVTNDITDDVTDDVTEETELNGGNIIIEDLNNSSMEGCVACSNLFLRPSETSECSSCHSPCHERCSQASIATQGTMVCNLCYQKEIMDRERRGTKRKQEQQLCWSSQQGGTSRLLLETL